MREIIVLLFYPARRKCEKEVREGSARRKCEKEVREGSARRKCEKEVREGSARRKCEKCRIKFLNTANYFFMITLFP